MALQMTQAEITKAMREVGNLPVLGWRLSYQFRDLELTFDQLVNALKEEGLTDYTPTPTTPREALRRALEEWVRDRAKKGVGPRFGNVGEIRDNGTGKAQRALVRAVNRRGKEVMQFALVTEEISLRDLGLDYGGIVYFKLNKTSGDFLAVVIEDSGLNDRDRQEREHAMYQEVAPLYAKFRTLQVEGDISKAVRRNVVVGLNALPLRENGGEYFIPVDSTPKLEALRRFFDKIDGVKGGIAALTDTVVFDVQGASKKMGRASQIALEDQLAAMEAELSRLIDQPDGTVRPATVAGKIKEYQEFRAKAEAYGDLLGIRQENIASGLDRLQAAARKIVLKGAGESVTDAPAEEMDAFDMAVAEASK